MGVGSAQPPVNPPNPRPLQQAPEPGTGATYQTDDCWFAKFTHWRELVHGDHFEETKLLQVSLAMSLKTELTLGWHHSTVIGGSLTRIEKLDTKLNLGGFIGFIGFKKEEITKGMKKSRVYAGVKIGHITGTRSQFTGSDFVELSAVEKAELLNNTAEYWTAKAELEKTLNEHINNLKREHTTLDETITNLQNRFNQVEVTADAGKVEGSSQVLKSDTITAECQNVKQQASSNYEILADASAELLASGKWEGYCRGDVKLMASGLQKFAASISKLG